MVELANLQQVLSMSSVTEKVQQVQQQLPDVQARQDASDFRELADTQKTKVRETEEDNPSNLVHDKKESTGNNQGKRQSKKRKGPENTKLKNINANSAEIHQGKIVDVSI